MEEAGLDNPLRRLPELRDDLLPFWQCFDELDQSRPLGDSWTPIPVQAVESWCRVMGMGRDFRRDCWQIVRRVDLVRCSLEMERREEEREKRKREAEAARRKVASKR